MGREILETYENLVESAQSMAELREANASRSARRSMSGPRAGAGRIAVPRLCQRCRELLRDEIAQTLDDASQVEQELRSLLQALAC